MVATAGFVQERVGALVQDGGERCDQSVAVDGVVPQRQMPHACVTTQPFLVAAHNSAGGFVACTGFAAQMPCGHIGARGQALDVPFPGADVAFIEVVDSENQFALG